MAAQPISIHAPHTGRDGAELCEKLNMGVFQSTRPIRGATLAEGLVYDFGEISIHAPHTGRDCILGQTVVQ